MGAWIYGYFGRFNVGDEAILASVLANRPEWVVPRVLTWDVRHTRRVHQTRCCLVPPLRRRGFRHLRPLVAYWMRNWPRLLPDLYCEKACIYACGGSVNDHWPGAVLGMRDRVATFRTFRCRVGLLGAGVDRLVLPEDREAARMLITDDLSYCSVRDASSAASLRELGVSEDRFRQGADLAFALPYAPQHRTDKGPADLRKARVGLNLRPLFEVPQVRGTNKADRAQAYREACRGLVADLRTRVGALALVPFGPDDVTLLTDLGQATATSVDTFNADPRQVLTRVGSYDVFVGMRFHSVVFSVMNAIPCVAIPYASKVMDLAKQICPEASGLAVGDGTEMVEQELNPKAVCEQVHWVWENRKTFVEKERQIAQQSRKIALADMADCWTALRPP